MGDPFPTDPVLWAWLAALGVSLVALLFVLAMWIVGHAFWPRMDRLGLNDAFLHRGTQLFLYGLMIGWMPLFLVEIGIVRDWDMGFLVLPILGSILAAWVVACLGMNFVLFFTRGESRVRETMEADLRAARDVQRRLLPATAPVLPGLGVAGSCDPAREVGGDYFDYLVDDSSNRLLAVVADVAGKGLSAAMLATYVKGALGTALDTGADLDAAALAVGRQIRKVRRDRRFVTLVLAELDPETVRRAVLAAVVRFRDGAPASDDVTVVALRFDSIERASRAA